MRNASNSALLVVDMQYDFLPGGALPTADGDRIVEPIRRLLESNDYGCVVMTQDWHPPGHISFASSHPGHVPFQTITLYGRDQVLWPDHCLPGTRGAAIHGELPMAQVDAIVRKGTDPKTDSYSAFRNNWDEHGQRPRTGLAGYLHERGVEHVFLCGLARDYCVLWSAEDAADAGFQTTVIWDLTSPVDAADDHGVHAALDRKGVRVIEAYSGSANT